MQLMSSEKILVGSAVVFVIWLLIKFFKWGGLLGKFAEGEFYYRPDVSGTYICKYSNNLDKDSVPSVKQVTGTERGGRPNMKFFEHAKGHLVRDYILIVDRSTSMAGSNWSQARGAVETVAPYTVKFDPDGITLIFFSNGAIKLDHITTAEQVHGAFARRPPNGSTNLTLALDVAFQEHFNGTRGATTILVVTDGAPNNQSTVEKILQKAANSIRNDFELSVSFIQVGDDDKAAKFLKKLDDALECKFDIVDTLSWDELRRSEMTFSELIVRSLYD